MQFTQNPYELPYLKSLTKLLFLLSFSVFLIWGCSQEKNTFINRGYHNVTSKFNGYYNGREKIREGVKKLESNYKEDYKSLLPLFIYGTKEDAKGVTPEMDLAIEKFSRVIEMHSMSIGGKEYCKWIDDTYMGIGKANFYKQEYDEAKSFFEYVAKEYKRQPIKFEALLWMVRTYVEKERYSEAERILTILEGERNFPPEYIEEKSLVTADYFIKQQNYEMAIPEIKQAITLTKKKSVRIRLLYILAQLYQLDGDAGLAIGFYKEVIKSHPPYEMEFYAKISLATAFSSDAGGGNDIIELLTKMINDDKNLDYLDQIYYALAEVYIKNGDEDKGIEALKMSAKSSTDNRDQKGLSFYKLAQIYFDRLSYESAQKYYDSTKTYLSAEHPDFDKIIKISTSLTDLVKNIKIIEEEDSLQSLTKLSEKELEDLIYASIDEFEKEQERKEREFERDASGFGDQGNSYNSMPDEGNGKWYFYNPTAISFGANEFKRVWGARTNEDNWRRSNKESSGSFDDLFAEEESKGAADSTKTNDPTDFEYYTQAIPFSEEQLAESNKRLVKAYYDLGVIYKDQLEDNLKSIETLELLVQKFDTSDYHLVSYYRLYRLYDAEGNTFKSNYYKDLILTQYPDSEYAKLILNPDYFKEENQEREQLVAYYEKTYGYYKRGYYKACITNCEESETKFPKNDLQAKFLLLKAQSKGRMGEKEAFIAELESLSKNFGSKPEGKEAQEILNYWTLSQAEAKKRAEEEELLKKGYDLNKESKHTAVLIVPNLDMDMEKVKASISNFNTQYFKTNNLSINAIFIDKENQMVSIKNFDNAEKALSYYNTFLKNQTYLKDINDKAYDFFVISFENYPIYFQKKDTKEYLDFFSKSYLNETN